AEILSKCRRLKGKVGLDLIVIDHIQLMDVSRASRKGEVNRQQEITEISRNLKMIAKELDVPVLALSQLSRLVTGRKGQRPMLSDLRESGAIEQDADIVMFIHRPDKVADGKEVVKGEVLENVAEILIEKNRSGEVGSFELLFEGAKTRFVDLPAGYHDRQSQVKALDPNARKNAYPPENAEDLQNAPFVTGYSPAPYDEEFVPPEADGYGENDAFEGDATEETIPDASESF
ncbi:MAG: DnaB-like helicase C-terminal domain-containing protein, partial [Clostridia bacterium]|nr:DnaB-like helicase C-terminal domain-containing protein [Clostridia bacterium]